MFSDILINNAVFIYCYYDFTSALYTFKIFGVLFIFFLLRLLVLNTLLSNRANGTTTKSTGAASRWGNRARSFTTANGTTETLCGLDRDLHGIKPSAPCASCSSVSIYTSIISSSQLCVFRNRNKFRYLT